MSQSENFCRQCLIREMADQDNIHSIRQYVDRIDEDIKAPSELYEHRLNKCKQCEQLLNGMCRVCGCFVEMRAAVTRNYCPAVEKKW